MNNLENAYNQALEMLKKGHSKEEVLIKFAEFKNELSPLLDISFQLLTLPKNIVPTPMMRRKYAVVPAKRLWLAWLHVSKFASISVGLMLIISALSVTAYQASVSTPGNALFALKKGEESIRLVLAFNQNRKASLQVAIAQQRLSDAQQIFNDPTSNAQQKTAALNELSAQTASAVAEVNTVAATNPKSADSHPLLSSLDNITQQQKNLLTAIKPDSQIKNAANSALVALGNDTAKLSAIKQTIAVAGNDQEALAKLSSDPNSVAAFGLISRATSSQITVNQITFNITPQTTIQDSASNSLLFSNLHDGDKASVVGEKNNNLLVAQQIFITSTSTDNTASTSASSTVSVVNIKKPAGQSSTTIQSEEGSSTSTHADSNVVTAPWIVDTPASQYVK
jgi:hypothetical protein